MKKLIVLLYILLLPSISWGACTEGNECVQSGTTWTCPTLELACMQAAHDDANCKNGDTISLPAGTLEWPDATASTLKLTKAIRLVGQGKTSTIIQQQYDTGSNGANCYDAGLFSNGACFVSFKPDETAIATIDSLSDTVTFEISNIHFEVLNSTSSVRSVCLYIKPTTDTAIRRVKIHNNKFTGISESIYGFGNIYGVVYSNEYVNSSMVKIGGKDTSWVSGPALVGGGADYLYFEDNTTSGWDGVSLIAGAGQGGRYALRYNTIDTYGYTQLFEWHGNQDRRDPYGTMATEIYGNKITSATANPGILGRGGTSMIYYNYDDTRSMWMRFYEEYPNGCHTHPEHPSAVGENTITPTTALPGGYDYTTGYSVIIRAAGGGTDATKTRDIVSYADGVITVDSAWSITTDDYYSVVNDARALVDQTQKNTYVFQNFKTTNMVDTCCTDSDEIEITSSYSWYWSGIAENVNIWKNYPMTGDGAFDGTKGVGCGTLATLQGAAYWESCTDGVGFWIPNAAIDPTAASCADISSYVGANNATVASAGNMGSLWKCSSNSWANSYTPYTYPHPLRGEGGSGGSGHSFSGGATHSFTGGSTITWQ